VRGENEFINNVVYGYETSGYIMGDTTAVSHANVEGNYFIEGPVDGSSPFASGTSSFHIYASDNWVDSNRNGVLDGSLNTTYPGADVVSTRHAFPTGPSMSAQDTVPFVMNNFGPNITRDAVDARLAQEIGSYGTFGGVIDRETTTYPGYGTDPVYLNPRARLVDTDNDGMPDSWETSKGLNPNSASDWKNLGSSGYTQLEQYLNELGGYESTRTAVAGGAWTSAATWSGATPTFSDGAVAAGTVNVSSGNGFARRLTLNGNLNVTGGTLDVFDTIAVNGTATLSGGTTSAGQVLLGSTGQTGALSLTGGTLQTGTIGSGGGTASLSLNGGTIKFTGTPNVAVATTVGANGATLNTNGFTGSITGGLSGTGTLTKTGAGTLTLGGNNSGYSGGINLNAGAITLNTNGANSSTGAITAANGTTLNVTASGASTPLALANGATVTITAGGLTYNGAITGAVGTTLLVSNSSSGTSNFSIGGSLTNFAGTVGLASSTGNIRINQGGSPLANFNLGTSTGTIRTQNDGTTNFGSLSGGANTRLQGSTNGTVASTYVIGANGNSTTFAGTITNGTNTSAPPGITNITKTGAGTLTFSGANVYTGTTTINGGVLRVNGSHVGGGTYTINASGTLGGNGSISSPVTVNDGGAISPGNSPGVLSVGSLTLAGGADFVVELNGTSSYDQLNVTGSTSIYGADLLASLSYVPELGDILYILKNDDTDAIGGTFAGLAQDGLIDLLSSTDQRTYTFRISYTANAELSQPTGGNDIALTAVPEPGATGAVLLAMGGILSRRRRDRR
jgi:autotransporter-associated beta strand protein